MGRTRRRCRALRTRRRAAFTSELGLLKQVGRLLKESVLWRVSEGAEEAGGAMVVGVAAEQAYDTAEDCCRNPWIANYATCMADMGEDVFANNPYYPDYFYNACLNDGQQSPLETSLFDTLEDCCGDEWINYDSCMSNAES